MWGVVGSFSIIYSVLSEAFRHAGPAGSNVALKLSFVISVNAITSCGGCLVAGPLYDRFGVRVTTASAVILGHLRNFLQRINCTVQLSIVHTNIMKNTIQYLSKYRKTKQMPRDYFSNLKVQSARSCRRSRQIVRSLFG